MIRQHAVTPCIEGDMLLRIYLALQAAGQVGLNINNEHCHTSEKKYVFILKMSYLEVVQNNVTVFHAPEIVANYELYSTVVYTCTI